MTEKELNELIEELIPELSFVTYGNPMDIQWTIDYAKAYARNYLRKKKGEKDGKKKTNQCKIGQKNIQPNRNKQEEH